MGLHYQNGMHNVHYTMHIVHEIGVGCTMDIYVHICTMYTI